MRLDAKEEDQERRHQRAAADPGQSDHESDEKPCGDEREFMHGRDSRVAPCKSELLICSALMRISLCASGGVLRVPVWLGRPRMNLGTSCPAALWYLFPLPWGEGWGEGTVRIRTRGA